MSPAKVIDLKKYIRDRVAIIGGCWIWQKSVDGGGYPRAKLGYKTVGAHRIVWQEWKGEIPKGQFVRTRCRNPLCVSPNHLWLTGPGLISEVRKDHPPQPYKPREEPCIHGHAYNPATRVKGQDDNGRPRTRCGECNKEKGAKYRARRREQRQRTPA